MEDIADKSDSTSGAVGKLPASQYNDHKNEIQKCVERSGQTLNPAILDQFPKALFINATGAASVIDSGSGNTITLQPTTGGSGLVPPDDYVQFNGGVLRFNKADQNTGTAVTISLGTLSAKPLVRKDLSLPAVGDVIGECFVRWDNPGDRWILLRNETDTYKYLITAGGAISPKFPVNEIEFDVSGGNLSNTIDDPLFIGQDLYISASGSNVADFSGTGLYINKIFLTENTGVLHIKSVLRSGVLEWRAENAITADYVSGETHIKKRSDGELIMSGEVSQSISTTTAELGGFRSSTVTISFPINYADTTYLRRQVPESVSDSVSVYPLTGKLVGSYGIAFWNGASSGAAIRIVSWRTEGAKY